MKDSWFVIKEMEVTDKNNRVYNKTTFRDIDMRKFDELCLKYGWKPIKRAIMKDLDFFQEVNKKKLKW